MTRAVCERSSCSWNSHPRRYLELTAATARQLKAFQERELTELDVVALFLDGKTFAND